METKSSIQALGKDCETIEDLLKVNGFIKDLNNGKEINFVIEGQPKKEFSAEKFIKNLK